MEVAVETNKVVETAQKLRVLAEKMEASAETLQDKADLKLFVFANTKEEAAAWIRAIGGKWKKRISSDTGEWQSMYFDSESTGLSITLPRNKVCRRLNPEWECEPIMSPEEEAEMMVEA